MWLSARFIHSPDEPIQIRMKPDGDELLIQSASTGNVVARWAFSSLYKSDESTLKLYSLRSSAHEATVEITDLDAMKSIDWLWRLPAQKARDPRKTIVRAFGGLALVTIGLIAGLYFTLENLPASWETKLFRDRRVFANATLCRSELGTEALLSILKPLLELRNGGDPLRVSVYKSETFETFAFPANRIFVSSGLLARLATPAELLGVIAHQMEHVAKRHPLQTLNRDSVVASYLRLLFPSEKEGNLDPSLVQLLARPRSSADEERVIREGAAAQLERANLDPSGLAQLFARLRDQGEFPSFYTDHHMDQLASAPLSPVKTDVLDSDWLALKKICD
jgi:beta-barrel assembly-enhancing protease